MNMFEVLGEAFARIFQPTETALEVERMAKRLRELEERDRDLVVECLECGATWQRGRNGFFCESCGAENNFLRRKHGDEHIG